MRHRNPHVDPELTHVVDQTWFDIGRLCEPWVQTATAAWQKSLVEAYDQLCLAL